MCKVWVKGKSEFQSAVGYNALNNSYILTKGKLEYGQAPKKGLNTHGWQNIWFLIKL